VRAIITGMLLGAVVLLAAGCNSSPSVPYPADKELIDLFYNQKARFEQLKKDPKNKDLLAALGIMGVSLFPKPPAEIWFKVWVMDFPGPGGCAKGYAYLEKAPAPIVKSIDDAADPGSPEQMKVFRIIEGNWYLYYASAN